MPALSSVGKAMIVGVVFLLIGVVVFHFHRRNSKVKGKQDHIKFNTSKAKTVNIEFDLEGVNTFILIGQLHKLIF